MRRPPRTLIVLGVAALFMGSCVAIIPVAMRLADPMTRHPLDSGTQPFPVLVVSGDSARVQMLENVEHPPEAAAGSTYLVPAGKRRAIERYLQKHEGRVGLDGAWSLRVEERAPEQQRIELVWLADGFSGAVYDAGPKTIMPLYRKLTGPGFAFVFGPLALALNCVLWALVWLAYRWYSSRSGEESRLTTA